MEEERCFICFLKNAWYSNKRELVEDGSGKTCECEGLLGKYRWSWSW